MYRERGEEAKSIERTARASKITGASGEDVGVDGLDKQRAGEE